MARIKPGWYIVVYHDISWEENLYIRSLGGTCPPDIFREQVKTLASRGQLVSITDGQKALEEDSIREPLISFWFDDGLTGVAKYAQPILENYGVSGAISVCSQFFNRAEFFWRFQLSYLDSIGRTNRLRPFLEKKGMANKDSIGLFTLDHFDLEIVNNIRETYQEFTSTEQRNDAYRMFMDRETILSLHESGWCIANHSARHYPISQVHSLHMFSAEYEQCEEEIINLCGKPSAYWVLPFFRNNSPDIIGVADESREDRHLVFGGFVRNSRLTYDSDRIIYRLGVPVDSSNGLIRSLQNLRNEPSM